MANKRLRVRWHTSWNQDLEHALNALPEMEACPRELYRMLLTMEGGDARIALVEDGEPAALIGVRQADGRFGYELITNWLIPGAPFPARDGMILKALDALELPITCAWWRMPAKPELSMRREATHAPSFGMACSEDFEAFWRQSSLMRTMRKVRRDCEKFRHVVNAPGAAEWVIRNWDKRWRADQAERPSLKYRLKVADYLTAADRHFTQAVYDGDKLIAGATQIVQGDASVASVLHYEPEYRKIGMGHHLIDLHFQHARETGFKFIDLGGGHDYKTRYAPVAGERSTVKVWPAMLLPVKYAALAMRDVKRRLHGAAAPEGERAPAFE